MYFPFLIEAGMVYKGIPPLYSIPNGKKRTYFIDHIDMIKYVQKKFVENNTIADNNGELHNRDITKFLLTNADYIYYLDKISSTYAVNNYLLEIVLVHYLMHNESFDFKSLQKEIKSNYRFMDVYNEKGNIIIKGSIESSNFIICNNKFIADCYDILRIMKQNESLSYIFNGNRSYIYNIMLAYNKATPNNVQRYKGLGEMPGPELAESTLLPENRTLIRYTMEDAKETFAIIREYESNSKKILSLVQNVTRDDLVE